MRNGKSAKQVRRKRGRQGLSYRALSFMRYALLNPVIIALILVLSAATWFYYSGYYNKAIEETDRVQNEIAHNLGLNIKDILVEGQVHTSKDDILNSVTSSENYDNAARSNASIFDIDLERARENLEKLAWVKHASIERQYPSTLSIRITERVPVALWQDSGKLYLIDEEGKIIEENNLEEFSNLVIMIGKDVPAFAVNLLQMLKAEPELASLVSSATRISKRRWDIKLFNGTLIKLPEEAPEKAWAYLAQTNNESRILKAGVKTIDLRVEDKMFVQ